MANKTILALLFAAIVVSIGGTIISLNKLSDIGNTLTGMVTTGTIDLDVSSTASLNVTNGTIDFGACTPSASVAENVTSNRTAAGSVCTTGVQDVIQIANDGNVDINVSVYTDTLASALIGGTNPQYYFKSANGTANACEQNLTDGQTNNNDPDGDEWIQFTATGASNQYIVCGNLSYNVGGTNLINVSALVTIPNDAPVASGSQATLTFTATDVS